MARWLRFLIAILVGIGLGLIYGWLISPVKYVDTAPDTLHIQYKTDYVLMVAETYQADNNLEMALRRLGALGSLAPGEMVFQAIVFAQRAGYTDADLRLMQNLLNNLQTTLPVPGLIQESPQP
jgi:hypothetical protein